METPYLGNLRAVYLTASDSQKAAGKLWYPTARGQLYDLAKRYRQSLKRTAYVAATLSNNREWGTNMALAERVIRDHIAGAKLSGHYGHLLDKSLRILTRGDFKQCKGPKVAPFARALYGDTSAAVIDRWMLRAADPDGSNWPNPSRIRRVAGALKALARELRQSVTTVQATIWLAIRGDA